MGLGDMASGHLNFINFQYICMCVFLNQQQMGKKKTTRKLKGPLGDSFCQEQCGPGTHLSVHATHTHTHIPALHATRKPCTLTHPALFTGARVLLTIFSRSIHKLPASIQVSAGPPPPAGSTLASTAPHVPSTRCSLRRPPRPPPPQPPRLLPPAPSLPHPPSQHHSQSPLRSPRGHRSRGSHARGCRSAPGPAGPRTSSRRGSGHTAPSGSNRPRRSLG